MLNQVFGSSQEKATKDLLCSRLQGLKHFERLAEQQQESFAAQLPTRCRLMSSFRRPSLSLTAAWSGSTREAASNGSSLKPAAGWRHCARPPPAMCLPLSLHLHCFSCSLQLPSLPRLRRSAKKTEANPEHVKDRSIGKTRSPRGMPRDWLHFR